MDYKKIIKVSQKAETLEDLKTRIETANLKTISVSFCYGEDWDRIDFETSNSVEMIRQAIADELHASKEEIKHLSNES